MIIYFLETESAEEMLFASRLQSHEVRFVTEPGDVAEDAEIVSVFISSKIDADFINAHPRLRLIVTRSTAYEHIDLAACRARDVRVCHVPNYGETTVAEHTFALILAVSRRLREVMQAPKDGRFSYEATRGFELSGKTLGIIGMGHIGQRVVSLAHAFQMRVLAYDVEAPEEVARTLHFTFAPLDELLARADILSLHASLSPQTYHILNRESLARCKRGVVVINTARGALIETAALREALDSGQVGGAGLDVLQDERVLRERVSHIIADDIIKHLRSDDVAREARDADRIHELRDLMLGDDVLSRRNVIFTPHVAFNSVEAIARLQELTLENIRAFLEGEPTNLVA